MGKLVLVTNTVNKCKDCRLFGGNQGIYWCYGLNQRVSFEDFNNKIHPCCPLKKISDKREVELKLNERIELIKESFENLFPKYDMYKEDWGFVMIIKDLLNLSKIIYGDEE